MIVPIYNGAADLSDLLSCLAAQTYPQTGVEYLLVDNHSQDQTPALLKTAMAAWEVQGLRGRSLLEATIQSSYAARNTGIVAAQGEILVFTDADCRPVPDWLTHLVAPFEDETMGLSMGEVVALPGNSLLEQYAERKNTLSQRHTLNHPFCPYGQTANLAVRRSLLTTTGLFRPHLTTGGDADLCWRILRETGCGWQFVPEAIVQHRHRRTLGELNSQWRRYGRSNQYLHHLHGVPLMRPLTAQELAYRLARWAVKELPPALLRGQLLDVVQTPLDLFTFAARSQGQKLAVFDPQMAEIPILQ